MAPKLENKRNTKNMSKYIDAVRSCGYDKFEFKPIRINHIAEFYEYEDMFLKVSPYNKNTKGFLQEYNMIRYIYSKGLEISPKPISFKEINGIQMICMQKVDGRQLTRDNDNKEVAFNIRTALQKMYSVKAIHGDIKPDNILVMGNDICLIDFDQSYMVNEVGSFDSSPDIIGNEGRNLTRLMDYFKI